MIVLFTDFGLESPYPGQMHAAIVRAAPDIQIIDLFHHAPRFAPMQAGYLLAALTKSLPPRTVIVGVVDPGVGSARTPVIVEADDRYFVGPDNGLFAPSIRQARSSRAWQITWQPTHLSPTFHGRDLFAPVAARIAAENDIPGSPISTESIAQPDWPDDLAEIIYIDPFGNAMTGLRAAGIDNSTRFTIAGTDLSRAATFSDVPVGAACWFENSSGLVEIAVNQGSAAAALALSVGDPILT